MEMLMSLFTLVSILSMLPDIESSCVNLGGRLSCLDFNCSMSWNTVANSEPESQEMYTLYYAKAFTAHDVVQVWDAVEGCINVSVPECNVRALFQDDDDFRGFKRFRIDYVTNGTDRCRGRKFQRDPLRSVVLSAPPITHVSVMSEELSFRLIYPTDNHYPGLDLQLLRQFVNHKYHVTIREYDTNATVLNYVIMNDLSGIQRIYDLLPATRYVIRVRSAVYPPTVWSPDTAIRVVRTLEKPPSIGPRDLKILNSSFSCTEPDLREIILQWKAVEEEYWNGDLLFYEIRAISWESREIFMSITVNRSSAKVFVKGLSRWEDYDLVVFANNSAGGTRNDIPLTLKSHIVDERGSQPRSVSISSHQRDKTAIRWQPPINYQECITGYSIAWTDEQGRDYHVIELENTWLDVKGHVMKIQVTPLLRKGYESYLNGITLTYSNNSNGSGSGFNLWFLLLVGVIVLILVVAVLLVAKWKYIKLRWLKPQFKDNFNLEHNKVLRPAFDRQVSYEPCLRQEKEVFDAPSPCIHNLHDLPPWSPDFVPSPGYEQDVPLMTALLQQGFTVVDDIDEIDLAQATRDATLEATPSQSSSNMDSAIDTLSHSDVDAGGIQSAVPPSDEGYIAHHNLREHLRAIDPINDYAKTGVSGYVPLDSSADSPTESMRTVITNPDTPSADDDATEQIDSYTVAGAGENMATPSLRDSPTCFDSVKKSTSDGDQSSSVLQSRKAPGVAGKATCQPSCYPRKAQKFESPYVPHSEVMHSSLSSCSDRSGEDIADYSKQTTATNLPIKNKNKTHLKQEHAIQRGKQNQTKYDNTPSTTCFTHDEETLKSLQRDQASVLPFSQETV